MRLRNFTHDKSKLVVYDNACSPLSARISSMAENAERLFDVVVHEDKEAALKLLEAAGGACQARKLAQQGESMSATEGMSWSLVLDGDKEQIMLYHYHSGGFSRSAIPIVGIWQKRCSEPQ
jgi:hypothetical protein